MLSPADYDEVLQMRREFTALREDWERTLSDYYARKAGFRQDQPRWPRGSGDDSGRWSGGAGTGTQSTEPSTNPKSGGHHYVPGQIYRNEPLKPETRKVFEGGKTAPLRGETHGFDKAHSEYNKAVKETFDRFKTKNGIVRSEDMTPEQAKKFLDEVKASSDPRIRNFNMRIFMQQFRYYLRRIPRRME